MLVIGENINASNKSVAEAIENRDEQYLVDLAKAQESAGADFIDVNAGSGHGSPEKTTAAIRWLVGIIQAAVDKPLAIDSDSSKVIEAALKEYSGEKLIINSVTAEPARLESIGPLVAEREAWVVALAMGTEGIPALVEERVAACERIMSYLNDLGIKAEQVLFDPLVLPIAVDTSQGLVTLRTIEQIKSRYPDARTVMGLSNVSYGLPKRKLVNRAFLLMAAHAGLDAVIVDPLDSKAMSLIKVADLLTGKDPSCRAYLRAHRKGDIVD
ncbi:MAG: dihydropteroate synthase [Dehalococcoidia bacterium]|nr:dihydropteroate synthase [Dehalococcoidia bacterium]